MKHRWLLLPIFSILLTSCSFLFSDGSSRHGNSSNQTSYNPTSSSLVDDGSLRIVRIQHPLIEDYDYIFTNGGYRDFTVELVGSQEKISGTLVNWKIFDKTYLSVDSGGNFDAKKAGVTKIAATYQGHYAEKEINIATIARTFEMSEDASEFRVGQTYDWPVNITPTDATLFITLSNNDVISIDQNNDKKFKVLGVGEVDVSITAFTEWTGKKTTLDFKIKTIDPSSPSFYLNNKAALQGEVTFAKNKYKEPNYSAWGITAKSASGMNITNQITIASGSVDLSRKGTYSVVLKVTDSEGLSANFDLTIIITDYEVKTTKNDQDAYTLNRTTYELVKESSISLAISSIIFTSSITINNKYHHCEGTVKWYVYFKITNWGGYRTYDYEGDAKITTVNVSDNGQTTISLRYEFKPGESLNKDTFAFCGDMALFNGTAYEYKYYN